MSKLKSINELFKDFYNKELSEYLSWPTFRERAEKYFDENHISNAMEEYSQQQLEAERERIIKGLEVMFNANPMLQPDIDRERMDYIISLIKSESK